MRIDHWANSRNAAMLPTTADLWAAEHRPETHQAHRKHVGYAKRMSKADWTVALTDEKNRQKD